MPPKSLEGGSSRRHMKGRLPFELPGSRDAGLWEGLAPVRTDSAWFGAKCVFSSSVIAVPAYLGSVRSLTGACHLPSGWRVARPPLAGPLTGFSPARPLGGPGPQKWGRGLPRGLCSSEFSSPNEP